MFFNLRRHLRTSSREDTTVSSIYWFYFLFCSYQHHSRFVHLGDPAWVLQKDAGSELLHWKDERQPSTVSSAAKGLQPSPRLGSVQALRRQELTSIVGDVSLHAGHDVMWLSASRFAVTFLKSLSFAMLVSYNCFHGNVSTLYIALPYNSSTTVFPT